MRFQIFTLSALTISLITQAAYAARAGSPSVIQPRDEFSCRTTLTAKAVPPPIPEAAKHQAIAKAKLKKKNQDTAEKIDRMSRIEIELLSLRVDHATAEARKERDEHYEKNVYIWESDVKKAASPGKRQLSDFLADKIRVAEIQLEDGSIVTGHVTEVVEGFGGDKFVRLDQKVRFEFNQKNKSARFKIPNSPNHLPPIPIERIVAVKEVKPSEFWERNVSKDFTLADFFEHGKMYDSGEAARGLQKNLEHQIEVAQKLEKFSLKRAWEKVRSTFAAGKLEPTPRDQLKDFIGLKVVEFKKKGSAPDSKPITGFIVQTYQAPFSPKKYDVETSSLLFVEVDPMVRLDLSKKNEEYVSGRTETTFEVAFVHPNSPYLNNPNTVHVGLAEIDLTSIREVSPIEYADRNYFDKNFRVDDFRKYGEKFETRADAVFETQERVEKALQEAYRTGSEVDAFIYVYPAMKYSGKVGGLVYFGPDDLRVEIGENVGENAISLQDLVKVSITKLGQENRPGKIPQKKSKFFGDESTGTSEPITSWEPHNVESISEFEINSKEVSDSKTLPVGEVNKEESIVVEPQEGAVSESGRVYSRGQTAVIGEERLDNLVKKSRAKSPASDRAETVIGGSDYEQAHVARTADRMAERLELTYVLHDGTIKTPIGAKEWANYGIRSIVKYTDPETNAPRMGIIAEFTIDNNWLSSLTLIELEGNQFLIRSLWADAKAQEASPEFIDHFIKTSKPVNEATYKELLMNSNVAEMIFTDKRAYTLESGLELWKNKHVEYVFDGKRIKVEILDFVMKPNGTLASLSVAPALTPNSIRKIKDARELRAFETTLRYFQKSQR